MARRIIHPSHRRSYQHSTTAPSGSRFLIPLDQGPLREREIRRCRQIFTRVEEAKRKLARFEDEEIPRFQQWLYSRFGRELTRIREMTGEINRVEELIQRVRQEVFRNDLEPVDALEKIMLEEMEEDLKKDLGNEADEEDLEEAVEREEARQREEAAEKARRDEAARDEVPDDEDGASSQKSFDFDSKKGKASGERDRDSRIKDRYRALARKLHPDLNPQVTARGLELWHQVQAAYEGGDLETLDRLATLADIHVGSVSQASSISELREVFDQLTRALRSLERKFKDWRSHPAWEYSQTRNSPDGLRRYGKKLSQDLRNDLFGLDAYLTNLQDQVKHWAQQAPRRNEKTERKGQGRGRGAGRSRAGRSRSRA